MDFYYLKLKIHDLPQNTTSLALRHVPYLVLIRSAVRFYNDSHVIKMQCNDWSGFDTDLRIDETRGMEEWSKRTGCEYLEGVGGEVMTGRYVYFALLTLGFHSTK